LPPGGVNSALRTYLELRKKAKTTLRPTEQQTGGWREAS